MKQYRKYGFQARKVKGVWRFGNNVGSDKEDST
jgi:hypothetical protein